MISFYKPNKKNSGAACSLSWNAKESAVYISMIKQHSWNDAKRNGSFKENFNNPNAKLNFKLSIAEVAEIINTIERRTEFSGYHGSPNQIVKFTFKPGFNPDKTFRGLSFSVTKESKEDSTDKISILLGFNNGDLIMIREFLKVCLTKHCENSIKENLEKIQSKSNNGSSNKSYKKPAPTLDLDEPEAENDESESTDNAADNGEEEIW